MDSVLHVRSIRITPSSAADQREGLLAYARAAFAAFAVDGITIRRTLGNRLVVSYPSRESRSGSQFPHFLPTDPEVRAALNRRILAAYREREEGL